MEKNNNLEINARVTDNTVSIALPTLKGTADHSPYTQHPALSAFEDLRDVIRAKPSKSSKDENFCISLTMNSLKKQVYMEQRLFSHSFHCIVLSWNSAIKGKKKKTTTKTLKKFTFCQLKIISSLFW